MSVPQRSSAFLWKSTKGRPPMATPDLGRIQCSLRGRVPAGSWQTCVLTYRAGQAGIDDTGSLKIVTRYATDAGTPQFDAPSEPNYTTARASNGARLQLRVGREGS